MTTRPSHARARRLARDLLPPALTRAITERGVPRLKFEDGYASWAAATAAAGTYSASAILDQVRRATDEVIAGRAAFERDGVTFDQHEYPWPVAAALLWQASRGPLRVLDFGGSLGSTFRQLTPLLDDVDVIWGVVEQSSFVDAGRAYETERLRFFATIDECREQIQPTVALLSSVLQYLPDPHAVVRAILDSGVEAVIVDRTPFVDLPADVPVVQRVPAQIYAASYPAWLLGRDGLTADLAGWTEVASFPSLDADTRTSGGIDIAWRGLVAVRAQA